MEKVEKNSLLEIIQRTNELIRQAEVMIKNDFQIVLLVGNTGAGKSTIFNLLCGAEFEIREKGLRNELIVKEGTKNYSLMMGGTKSITKEPIYHFNEKYNHLIIDFPGFKDTGGEIEQLVIQLLFNKIVTNRNIKLLYVIQQSLVELPNRGTFIQEFIHQFQQQQIKFHQCVLIVNNFVLDFEDAAVIQEERDQLFSITNDPKQHLQQIIIIRQIDKKTIHLIKSMYKKLWENILLALEIELYPLKIEKTDAISSYIQETYNKMIYTPCKEIQKLVDKEINNFDKSALEQMRGIFNSIIICDSDTASVKLSKILEVIANFNSLIDDTLKKEDDETFQFIIILDFFQDYSEFILGYETFQSLFEQSVSLLNIIENQINIRLSDITKDEEIKQLLEEQKQIMQIKLQEQECEFQKQIQELKEQSKQETEEQIKIITQQQEQQVQQIQQQAKKRRRKKCEIF